MCREKRLTHTHKSWLNKLEAHAKVGLISVLLCAECTFLFYCHVLPIKRKYMCVCVCVCVRERRANKRKRKERKGPESMAMPVSSIIQWHFAYVLGAKFKPGFISAAPRRKRRATQRGSVTAISSLSLARFTEQTLTQQIGDKLGLSSSFAVAVTKRKWCK